MEEKDVQLPLYKLKSCGNAQTFHLDCLSRVEDDSSNKQIYLVCTDIPGRDCIYFPTEAEAAEEYKRMVNAWNTHWQEKKQQPVQ